MLEPGVEAPDFELLDDSGRPFRLHDQESWVLLWWYPKASTPTCTKEGCALRDLSSEFATVDCSIVGVSYDSVVDNRAFAMAHQFEFPLLADETWAVSRLYDVVRDPDEPYADMPFRISYLISPDHRVVEHYLVTDAPAHAADVLADVHRHQGANWPRDRR